MQYDMDVGGDAVPRRYLARVMAQPQRATVWGVRVRSGTPASSVWTLWLETRALPHGQGYPALRRSGQWVGCSISSPGPHGLVLSPHPCASIRPRHAQPEVQWSKGGTRNKHRCSSSHATDDIASSNCGRS